MSEWDTRYRAMASVAFEMIGAADYYEKNPEQATDERLAAAWRNYVARMRAAEAQTEVPA